MSMPYLGQRPQDMRSETPAKKMRWQERRESRRQARAGAALVAPERPTVGDFVGLCLLIDFPDVPGEISRDEVKEFCNLHGYHANGNNGSVFDYFSDNSGGKLHYTNIVAPYYTAKNNRDFYNDPSKAASGVAAELIREAVDSLRTEDFDFSPLSVDNEGCVYAINVLCAGSSPGHEVNGFKRGLSTHASSMDKFEIVPGKIAADYQLTVMGDHLTLGTFCHENGHMICEFPDLYDLGNDSFGVGTFCLMCFGGHSALNPTQINAYLKFRAGWANSVTEITAGLHTVRAGVNDFFIWRKNQQEYYIIENRHKSGRDGSLAGSGLAIWHVDEAGNNDNQNMTPELHYECSLVQADGEFDLELKRDGSEAKDLFHGGGNTRFGDTTHPNSRWWDGSSSGLEISDISDSGPEMTFVAN